MTTFLEFLAGNAFALGFVGVVAVVAVAIFALGNTRQAAARPTRPVSGATDLAESEDAVAVVGRVECDDPLATPFLGDDAVAYAVHVGSSLGHVDTLRAATAFTLVVDDERVTVTPGNPSDPTGTPVVDVDAHELTLAFDDPDDIDSRARDALEAFEADRSRVSRFLSGSVLPTRSERTYRVRWVEPGETIAVAGHLRRYDDEWVLAPDADTSLRFVDPATVDRTA